MSATNMTKKRRKAKRRKPPACTCPPEGDYHDDGCPAYQWNVENFLANKAAGTNPGYVR